MEVPLKSGQPAQLQVEKFLLFSVFISAKETSVLSTTIKFRFKSKLSKKKKAQELNIHFENLKV
jgi:hypothetical protein